MTPRSDVDDEVEARASGESSDPGRTSNPAAETDRDGDSTSEANGDRASTSEADPEEPSSTGSPRDPTGSAPDPTGPPPDPGVGRGLLDESMGPSSAMAHLYRGEVHRMKLWRERLDKTTNWAVIVVAAVLTWAFSSESNPHYVLLVGAAAITAFLMMEARRYRAYDIWRSRVRKIQEHVWAPGLDPDVELPDPEWRRRLAEDYRTPSMKITAEEAIAHRLRRVYLPLFTVVLLAWLVRVGAFADVRWPASAAIGSVPGVVVTAGVVGLYALAIVVACRPRTWHARDELRTESLRKRRRR